MSIPVCRFCQAGPRQQTIKGEHVYGGTSDQHFWECCECGMIYLYPPLPEKDEKEFYRREFEKFMENRSGGDMDWRTPADHVKSSQGEAIRRMGFLEHHLQPGMKVLEVGCSSGFMLSAMKNKGADVCGIDPSEVFIDYVRGKGIAAYRDIADLEKGVDHKFDLIIHYYVLEHVSDPLAFIRTYMQLLNPNGKMIFEVPCASDPLVALYKVAAFDKFYWSVAHHWYFNKKSMTALLDKSGFEFELFPAQRYDLSNHITWMLDGKPGGMARYSDIFGGELDEIYKEQLKNKWLCDTIVALLHN